MLCFFLKYGITGTVQVFNHYTSNRYQYGTGTGLVRKKATSSTKYDHITLIFLF